MKINARELRRAIEFLEKLPDSEFDYYDKMGYWHRKVLLKAEADWDFSARKSETLLILAEIAEYGGGFNTPQLRKWLEEHLEVYLTQGAREIVCPELSCE